MPPLNHLPPGTQGGSVDSTTTNRGKIVVGLLEGGSGPNLFTYYEPAPYHPTEDITIFPLNNHTKITLYDPNNPDPPLRQAIGQLITINPRKFIFKRAVAGAAEAAAPETVDWLALTLQEQKDILLARFGGGGGAGDVNLAALLAAGLSPEVVQILQETQHLADGSSFNMWQAWKADP